ncbi:MerR family DNA-binding transcriptional regulator [Maritalea mobilis]|uniref:MerR family transcriptional regulator n=1 Tax=Maritalea mobilis TaxID=483324 RepID=UPI001C982926|nr:MerR family DNA-binding transcriptional regulator [Maritalea mobilis]MBY6203138.1 MerR family DNA-binding transcriptional regulator [Maritalea mobilis]
MSVTKMDLKEMCAYFDVTPRTLRHYEYIELLMPERDGRKRLYGPREVARMTLILRGRRFGFSLEEIRQWLELYDQDPEGQLQRATWLDMADKQLAELDNRRRELEEVIAELRELRDQTARQDDAL